MKKIFQLCILLCAFCFFSTACDKCEHSYFSDCDEVCDKCGEVREVTVEHNYYGDCDSSCHSCGKKKDVTVDHNWKPATCTLPEVCEGCGACVGEPLGHQWKDADCTTPKTCTVCQATEGKALGHTAEADDGNCATARKCEACGEVLTLAGEHTPEADDGDCTTAVLCSACHNVAIPAQPQHFAEADDSDCATAQKCVNCEYICIPAAEHLPMEDDGDCTTQVWCSRCMHCAIEASDGHKDTDGNYRCENPGCRYPYNSVDLSKVTLGVGQVSEGIVNSDDQELIVLISDGSILQIEDVGFYENGGYSTFVCRGLREGTAIVAFLTSDGSEVVQSYEYTVKEEDTVRIGEGELVSGITVDKTTAEVYLDDTLVTYTVTTSADVDRLELVQLTHTYQMFLFDDLIKQEARDDAELVIFELDRLTVDDTTLSDTLVVNKELGTRYSATKTVNGDTATWTVKWDLGYTAVRFIRIKAIDTDTEAEQTNYIKLNITYPVLSNDEQGFIKALELYVRSNSTRPLLFKLDDGSLDDLNYAADLFRGLGTSFSDRFIDTAVYGGNSVQYLTTYSPVRVYDVYSFMNRSNTITERFGDKNPLCDYGYFYGSTLGFYYPVGDELRAVIAYRNGYEIDEELFPYAHSILERAGAVLDEIIEEGMTDFEKERAIYTWMYEQGVDGVTNGWTPTPEGVEEYNVSKTAYGLLNHYGGDCMGWSGAFYTLCNMAGLDCVTVDVLSSENGGPKEDLQAVDHRINMVRLDGEYYFVEAYWSWQKAEPTDGTYRYMNMTTERAAELYSWASENNGGPIVCESEGYLVDGQTGELLHP